MTTALRNSRWRSTPLLASMGRQHAWAGAGDEARCRWCAMRRDWPGARFSCEGTTAENHARHVAARKDRVRTERNCRIDELRSRGLTYEAIARTLGLTPNTVRCALRRLHRRASA